MKKFFTTRTIAELGLLTALVILLQLFSNYVTFGTVNITLSLIPIVLGAILYGPLGGLFLGLVNGAMVIVAPPTLASFMPYNAWATILLCLVKMGVAGVFSGLIFMLLKNKNLLFAVILASIIVPLTNTGLFIGGAFLFFKPLLERWAGEWGGDVVTFVFIGLVGINFIIEFVVNSVLAPSLYMLYNYLMKKQHRG